jgi:hypothetical protein
VKIEKLARKGILEITSYVPGKSIEEVQKEFGSKKWIKLASKSSRSHPKRTSKHLPLPRGALHGLKAGAGPEIFTP